MNKLKPCPNCGNEHPKIEFFNPHGLWEEIRCGVVCKACGLHTTSEGYDTEAEAIDIWNLAEKWNNNEDTK